MPKTRLGGAAVIKLTPSDVEKIMRDKDSTNAALGEKYGVSASRIWEIRHGIGVKTLMTPQLAKKALPTDSPKRTVFDSTRRRTK